MRKVFVAFLSLGAMMLKKPCMPFSPLTGMLRKACGLFHGLPFKTPALSGKLRRAVA